MDNPPVIDEDTSVSHLSGLNRSCDCWDECGHEVQNLCEVCDYETSSTADYWSHMGCEHKVLAGDKEQFDKEVRTLIDY